MNDSERGRAVARQYALWHLGDPSWADAIINVYLNPESAKEALLAEIKEEEGGDDDDD